MMWTGVLIEAEPVNFALALEKRRNVTLIPACLSLTKKPNLSAFNFGRNVYSKINPDSNAPDTVNVQCLPFYSVLLALNKTTIDVFCLDIEGGELDVLKTIPFDKVDIKVCDDWSRFYYICLLNVTYFRFWLLSGYSPKRESKLL